MGQLTLIKGGQTTLDQVNLFDQQGTGWSVAKRLREQEQRQRLQKLAEQLAEMLDRLDHEVRSSPERAASSVSEYAGLLERAVEDVCEIRDIDEEFGRRYRRHNAMVSLAERLEKGLNYLVGVFSVVATSSNIGHYNWRLVQRDIQEVLSLCRAIGREPSADKRLRAA